MTQPSLPYDRQDSRPPKKRASVPRSSVEAYRQTDSKSRARVVLTWLRKWNHIYGAHPTSAELADWACGSLGTMSFDLHVLYVRRGLSDLRKIGAVDRLEPRECAASGVSCVTWKVRTR